GIDRPALDILAVHLEGPVERAAGGDDAQIPVEDQQRLADRVDDRLRQGAAVLETVEWTGVGHGMPLEGLLFGKKGEAVGDVRHDGQRASGSLSPWARWRRVSIFIHDRNQCPTGSLAPCWYPPEDRMTPQQEKEHAALVDAAADAER